MAYLLDTNVVSEMRRARPHPAVSQWFASVDEEELFLPAIVPAELQAGIERTREGDPARADELQAWLDLVMDSHTVVAMDGETFRLWARLMHRKSSHLYEDAMIAATALRHGMMVVTRNVRDFLPFGVELVDPFGG